MKFEVYDDPEHLETVVTIRIGAREIHEQLVGSQGQMLRFITDHVVDVVSRRIDEKINAGWIDEKINAGYLDKVLADIIRDLVKTKVSDLVDERISDFFGDDD